MLASSYSMHSVGTHPMGSDVRGRLASQHMHSARPRFAACCAAAPANNARIAVQGKHMVLTPAIEEYAQKKVAHAIQAYQSVVNDVDVKLSIRGGDASRGERQQKMEVTIHIAGHGVIRAEETRDDLYASIDVASDKITRSLRKMKEKAVKKGQWPGRGFARGATKMADAVPGEVYDLESVSYDAPSDEEVESAKSNLNLPDTVERTKVFYLDSMTTQEAIDSLEFVDHDFYIYLDKDSGHVQAVYKRKAGGHGVIITIPDEASV